MRELSVLEDTFPLETAGSAAEAREVISQIEQRGDRLGVLFCDHLMPGQNGVEFLIELEAQPFTAKTRKVLLTGQAGLDATVKAVNHASLAHFVAKPWGTRELEEVARNQMTRYIFGCGIDHQKYMSALDPLLLAKALYEGMGSDR
jgi:response regulator RpfG family c-di-GMP phosphodiesterase